MKPSQPILRWCVTLTILIVGAIINTCAAESSGKPGNRGGSIEKLCERLGIGPGAMIGDVGCGSGADSLAFAKIVGATGAVFAEEIDPGKLKEVIQNADKNQASQVVPVLGQSNDPRLPNATLDLIYMRQVFHHFAQPRAMLRNFWLDLKPGGYLVVVDREKGPLKDWTPLEQREKEHHWTSETAVSRMAREEGFLFYGLLDDLWQERNSFVLVFRRPEKGDKPEGDPDIPVPLGRDVLEELLPAGQIENAQIASFALGQSRALLPGLQEKLKPSSTLCDVVLEEWALAKEEVPKTPELEGIRVLRTEKGQLKIPEDTAFNGIIFMDAYHRLWEPVTLLKQLRGSMRSNNFLIILDRQGPKEESRRLAHHHRRISSSLVREDLKQAGFEFVKEFKLPEKDRFAYEFRMDREDLKTTE